MCVHRIPFPTSVTTAKRPSFRVRDRRKKATDLGAVQSGIFLQAGLDDPNRIESLDEIAFYAQVIFSRPGRADGATSAEIGLTCRHSISRVGRSPQPELMTSNPCITRLIIGCGC